MEEDNCGARPYARTYTRIEEKVGGAEVFVRAIKFANQPIAMVPVFNIIRPKVEAVPIVLSVPHCGTLFPKELEDEYKKELISAPDDTDWFVHQLYDFAASMGIVMIHAQYSRWVIDLNRDPESKPLYSDGRIITGLCPTTDFLGNPLYQDHRTEIQSSEVERRVANYYRPYHEQLQLLLDECRNKFGKVLLWDCHSIRQKVPTIHQGAFPDLILGDADGTSASPGLIETTLRILEQGQVRVCHNTPFKGGYITRHFGQPGLHQHALQLEMTKVNYMDDAEMRYDSSRAEQMRKLLKSVFEALIQQLTA